MDGIVYLLDQSGRALSEANRQIEELRKHIEMLTAQQTQKTNDNKDESNG